MPRIFISCVTGEFSAYRVELAGYLERAQIQTDIQEKFGIAVVPTIQKLDERIQACDAVIHFLGRGVGSTSKQASAAFLDDEDKDGRFSRRMAKLGDFRQMDVSYTQWEAVLAEYREKPIFAYQASEPLADGHPRKGQYYPDDWKPFVPNDGDPARLDEHWKLLRKLRVPQYRTQTFDSAKDFIGKCLSDLIPVIGKLPSTAFQAARRFGPGKVDELKHLLSSVGTPLLNEGFVLAAFVQTNSALPDAIAQDRICDLDLVSRLAERKAPHDLLGFVKACEKRGRILGLHNLSDTLASWFNEALHCVNTSLKGELASVLGEVTEDSISGHCSIAHHYLFESGSDFARPSLSVAWRQSVSGPGGHVSAESRIQWGRVAHAPSLGSSAPIPVESAPTEMVNRLLRSKDVRNTPFARMEVCVSREGLNRPWEYLIGSKPEDEDPEFFRWPTVLRLLGRQQAINPPPDPLSRPRLACRLGQCESFISDARERGAFFAVPDDDDHEAAVACRAATRAGLGFWMRLPRPVECAEECLATLEGKPLSEIPKLVHKHKVDSARGSSWRDLSVLYDHPDWPSFEFYDDQSDLDDHIMMLQAHA